MKRIISISVVAGILFSCNKLTEDPASVTVAGQFYKTSADAIAAVSAVYSTLNSDPAGDFPIYGRNLNLLICNGGDEMVFSPSNTNPDVRALGTATYVPVNDRIRKIWQQHYYGISRANVAIDNIAPMAIDTTVRERLVRESKFIRALLYFNLVRLFGDVPLVLHDPTSVDVNSLKTGRTSKDSIYQQIIADLTAGFNLPKSYSGADIGRATSGAAHALLAKVYVTKRDWPNALVELQKVVTAGTFTNATGVYGYNLFTNFKDAFQKATKNGIEHLFSVQFETNLGARNSQQFISSGAFSSFNPAVYAGDIPADSSIYQLFDASDARRAVTFFTTLVNSSTGQTVNFGAPRWNKFIDYSISPLSSQAQSGLNFPVIRYADVLLLYAETLNELNGGPTPDAYSAINKVRTRAGIANLTTALPQAAFRDSVFLERRKEFMLESNRWFDLSRRGGSYLYDALKKFPAKTGAALRDTLYPIPQVEIDLAGLSQNPGWQ
ncbi:carbohydrate-binding protein SusD [Niastella koreensis]|uniref:RagB/SusD domain-containing protein n=2 Tax=Niastella koreensis TaxID=354356 RepID=G8TN64_NIAKG|nr:RagB/SusD family nutrient uptake outer membrane protein [Niastella koreensis]AEV97749.1 RagB/SusD domain-containing protein [Niastella koreensis GR20-10]OQP40435.1 carbohydrate-binding protein SusD [Niastella koreensis]